MVIKKNQPKLSIGMPVWNGEKQIASAIDSILSQSFIDFELIISDNYSKDATEEICRNYAKVDSRIQYFRQESNIGALKNFQFVLGKSASKYFMWAAADDVRTHDYVEENIRIIESSPSCIFSASPNYFEGDDETIKDGCKFEIKGNYFDRLKIFLEHSHESHACFYSVIKRSALVGFLNKKDHYLAFDWMVIIELLEYGEFHRASNGRLVLGRGGVSTQSSYLKKMQKSNIERLIPLYTFSKNFIKTIFKSNDLLFLQILKLIYKLLKLNIKMLIYITYTNIAKTFFLKL